MALLDCKIFQEENGWVSSCPLLEVSSFGTTPEEAKENLHEAVCGYLEILRDLLIKGKTVCFMGLLVKAVEVGGDSHSE